MTGQLESNKRNANSISSNGRKRVDGLSQQVTAAIGANKQMQAIRMGLRSLASCKGHAIDSHVSDCTVAIARIEVMPSAIDITNG